jgi:hypothetical protein
LGLKGGISMDTDFGPLCMCFDAVVVEIKKSERFFQIGSIDTMVKQYFSFLSKIFVNYIMQNIGFCACCHLEGKVELSLVESNLVIRNR